ncbi:MAG: hypothetical protein ACNA8W_08200, partial [Bradymonadaceae bacterium]
LVEIEERLQRLEQVLSQDRNTQRQLDLAIDYSVERLRQLLAVPSLDVRVEQVDEHAHLLALVPDIDLLEWSEKAMMLEEEVLERFLGESSASIEIQILMP